MSKRAPKPPPSAPTIIGPQRSPSAARAVSRRVKSDYTDMSTSPNWQSPAFGLTHQRSSSKGSSDDRPSQDLSIKSGESATVPHDNRVMSTCDAIDYSSHYFDAIFHPDPHVRKELLDTLLDELETSASGNLPSDLVEDYADIDDDTSGSAVPVRYGPGPQRLALFHVPTASFLSKTAPFPDIRRRLSGFVEQVSIDASASEEVCDFTLSDFFDSSEISVPDVTDAQYPNAMDSEHLCSVLSYIFLNIDSRHDPLVLGDLMRVLAGHPSYVLRISRLHESLMVGPGPLPSLWRAWIGVMAAAQLRSGYLAAIMAKAFVQGGGDASWLSNTSEAPSKLQCLTELNALLCHQPWKVGASHIEALVSSSWNIAEVSHAILLMTHFHSMAALMGGCGVTGADVVDDMLKQFVDEGTGEEKNDVELVYDDGNDGPSDHLALLSVLPFEVSVDGAKDIELRDAFNQADDRRLIMRSIKVHGVKDVALDSWCGDGITMSTIEFEGNPDHTWLQTRDMNWSDHFCPLLRTVYNGSMASMIDSVFSHVRLMTYHTLVDDDDVETGPFRVAVWRYVQRVFGVWQDDYHYKNITRYLSLRLRDFVKTAVRVPHVITKDMFCQNFGLDLKVCEKVHVVLLACEARRQSCLMYGLRAINAI